jgi:hypothetical protein
MEKYVVEPPSDSQNPVLDSLKSASKKQWMKLRRSDMVVRLASTKKIAQFYAPQTTISEGGTKDDIRIFDRLFNG